MSSFTGASPKADKSSIVGSHSFVMLSVLVLRMLLYIYGIEGIIGLIVGVGINGSFMMSKLGASIADDMMYGLLLLSSLIDTNQRIVPFENL